MLKFFMARNKIKIIGFSLLGVAIIGAAIAVPLVLRNNKKDDKTDDEAITEIKNAIDGLSSKVVTISATSGDITANKAAIKTGLEALSGYPTDLKGTT